MAEAGLKIVMQFFGMSAKDMMREWKLLSMKDREDISNGIANGSLTY